MIATEASRLAESIEQEPVRERTIEFAESIGSAKAMLEGFDPARPNGAFLDMFSDSPVSGSANPLTMGLRIATHDDHSVGRVTLQPGWQGAPGRAHGGIVAAIVDEVFGAMLPVLEIVAFTGELAMRFEAPCPMGVQLEFTARKTGEDGRKIYLECEGVGPDGTFVTSTATFITVDLSQFSSPPPEDE